jgi:hypothetical protein
MTLAVSQSDPARRANRFCALFDIVGFKSLKNALGTEGVYTKYERGILPLIQHSAAGSSRVVQTQADEVLVPEFGPQSVGYRVISDTVLFYSNDDSFRSFLNIVMSSFRLIQSGFSGSKAPFRGAIGWGDLRDENPEILVGSAIEDAQEGESSQCWAGCMLTVSCKKFVEEQNYVGTFQQLFSEVQKQHADERKKVVARENAFILVPYDVPTQHNPKDSPVCYSTLATYAVDWTIRMYQGAAEKSFLPSAHLHSQTIQQNTIEFEQWARANNR